MRFMIQMRADKDSEAGVMPSTEILGAMGRYNEELVKAGIMKAGEGLFPSAKGARVILSRDGVKVQNGPFPANETIAGYWLWDCDSQEEAIDWVKKLHDYMPAGGMGSGQAVIEVRRIFEAEDFGAEFTPELREQEERLRREMETKA